MNVNNYEEIVKIIVIIITIIVLKIFLTMVSVTRIPPWLTVQNVEKDVGDPYA